MNNFRITLALWAMFATAVAAPASGAEDEHGHDDGDEHNEEKTVVLTPEQRTDSGIVLGSVRQQHMTDTLRLPGEAIPNAYRSAQVAPRISAQVVKRHAHLGDSVTAGQPLVTLSSVAMADAQGDLVVADREWSRVKALGREVVAERRYTEAQVARQQALAKVVAYGMDQGQVQQMLKRGDPSQATGSFDLVAPQDGTVMSDDFIVGQLIEPGEVVFEITDEGTLWIEARSVPKNISRIEVGAPAMISTSGEKWREGKVVQLHHRLEEVTRTQALRIEIDNADDWLHPGEFVQVEVSTGQGPSALAVPQAAVVLLEGSSTVFRREHDNEFEPVAVQVGNTAGNWVEIAGGLTEGDQVVVDGAFVLKALLLKSELGEGHVH